jgi:hypothetical protein
VVDDRRRAVIDNRADRVENSQKAGTWLVRGHEAVEAAGEAAPAPASSSSLPDF